MRTIVLVKLTCEIRVGRHFHTVAIRMSQGVYTQKDPIQNREEDGEEEEGEDVDRHQKLQAKYRKLKKLLACKRKKALAKDEQKRRKVKTKRVHTAALRNNKCNSYRNAKKAGSHAHEKLKVQSRCETGRSDSCDDDLDMLVQLIEADEDIMDVLPSSEQFQKVEESLLKKKQKSKSIYDGAVAGTLVEGGKKATNLDDFPLTQPFKGFHWETAGLDGSSTQPMDVGKISERDILTDGRFSRCKETGSKEKVGRQESSPDNTCIFDGLLDETLMEYEAAEEVTSLDYSSSTLPFYQQSKDKNLTENGHLECDGGSIVTPEGRGSKNKMKKGSLSQNDSRKYPRKRHTEVKNCVLKVCKRETSILSKEKIMSDEDGRRETEGNQIDSDAGSFSDESMIIFSSGSEDEGFLSVSSKPPALTKGNDGTSLLTENKRKPWFIPDMPKERVQKDTHINSNKKSKKGGKKSEFISEAVELIDAQKRKTDMAIDGKFTCSNQQFTERTIGDSHLTKPKTISSQGKIIGSNKKNKKQKQKPGFIPEAVGLKDTQDCRNGVATGDEGTCSDQQLTETADGFSDLKKRSKFIPYKPSTIASQGKIMGSNKKHKKQQQKPGSLTKAVGLRDTQDCRNGVATDDERTFNDKQLTETDNGDSQQVIKKPVFIPYRPNVNESSQRSMDSAKEQPKKSEPCQETLELGDNQHCKSDMANDKGTGSSIKRDSHLTKGPGFIPYEPNVIVSQTSIMGPAKRNNLQERESESIPETLQDIAKSAVGDARNPADGLTAEETAKTETDLYPKMSDQTKLTDMKGWNLPKGWETYREATICKKTKGFVEAETHGGDGPVIPSHQQKRPTEVCPPRSQQEFTQSTSTQTETTFHQFLSFFSVCEKFFCDYENVTTTASSDNIGVNIDDLPSRKKLQKVMKKIKKSKKRQAKASKLKMSSSGQLSGSRKKRKMKHSAKKRANDPYTSPTGQSNMLHRPKLLFDKHTSSGPSSSDDFAVH